MRTASMGIALMVNLLLPAMQAYAGDTAAAFEAGKSFTGTVDAGAAAKSGEFVSSDGKSFGVSDVGAMSEARGGGPDLAAPPEASLPRDSFTLDSAPAYEASSPARWVTDTASDRPVFTLDTERDSLLMGGKTIKDDPEAIVGKLDETYSGCSTITVTSTPVYEEKLCHESRATVTVPCDKILTVACAPPDEGCADAGIVPTTVSVSDGSYAFTIESGALTLINTITAVNTVTTADFTFDIEGLDRVTEFAITGIHSDNWVGLRVNGTYIGTHSRHFGGFNAASDRLAIVDNPECLTGDYCGSPIAVQYSVTGYRAGVDTGRNYYSAVSFDLRPYLREGANTITMYVVNGGGPGYGRVYIGATQRCPRICTDVWENHCLTYEERAR